MSWLSNIFRRKPSETACLTTAVIKLWVEEPDQWTENRTKCFSIPYGMADGYCLTHKTHDIDILVPLCLGIYDEGYLNNRFSARAGRAITDAAELKAIAHAIIETRPHAALREYRAQMAAAQVKYDNTIKTLSRIGCSGS